MHPTSAFRHNDPKFLQTMVDEIGFASIFLQTQEGPRVAHTPVALDNGVTLRFHLARTNTLTRHLDGSSPLLMVNGPDAYISARWYNNDNQVPTWNYVAFEFEGHVKQLPPEALPDLLSRLSSHHEGRVEHGVPWTMEKMSESSLASLLRGIVGFEMTIDTVRETVKLSQNKPADERIQVIAGLEGEGHRRIAQLMTEITP